MNRRAFVAGFLGSSVATAQGDSVRLVVDPQTRLGRIPADFMGLGYEISSVSEPGLLSGSNHGYVRMVRALSPQGVIRIGGNTSDYATWLPDGPAVSSPKATVVDRRSIRDLGSFLRATGWRLIWGFNLGRGTVEQAVDEAIAVASTVGDRLLAFEIGNEPDLFPGVHRPANYVFPDYYAEYQRFKQAIRAKLPNAPFAGPDVFIRADWLEQFGTAEAADVKLLTQHFYPLGPPDNPATTIENLLKPNQVLTGLLGRLEAASRVAHLPYRICETNSCFGGGKAGVSDTLAAALWTLDFLFTLAQFNASGVNIETGINQLGFVSWYSPIVTGSDHKYVAKPPYFGMLAFAMAARGQRAKLTLDAGGLNITAYAVRSDKGDLWLTVINKEANHDAEVRARCSGAVSAEVTRLTGPSLASKDGVGLSRGREPARIMNSELELAVPAASAALIRLR